MSKYNPEIHHRKSIRLKEYNYSQEGMYFITICTKNRKCILSQIECNNVGADDPVCPNLTTIGNIVNECWYNMNTIYENILLTDFIIMPNHIHGIIQITSGRTESSAPTENNTRI